MLPSWYKLNSVATFQRPNDGGTTQEGAFIRPLDLFRDGLICLYLPEVSSIRISTNVFARNEYIGHGFLTGDRMA
jgi:hypothetical protein